MKNIKGKKIYRDIGLTITTNFLKTGIMGILSLILPIFLSISEYGYYQLYLFYAGYIILCLLGSGDGFLLRFAGKDESREDNRNINVQINIIIWAGTLLGIILYVTALYSADSIKTQVIFLLLGSSIPISCALNYYQCVYSAIGKFNDYNIGIALGQSFVLGTTIIGLFILKVRSCEFYILSYIGGQATNLIYYRCKCRTDVVAKTSVIYIEALRELKENIVAGIKVTLANLSGMLIVGLVKMAIQLVWSVETFGKVSLSLSLSNLFQKFVGAVAIVLLPMLKRMDSEKQVDVYRQINTGISVIFFTAFLLYYPLFLLFCYWLPEYTDSLRYMAILIPLCIYESKVTLLTNTYLKSMRMEKCLFGINISMVGLSVAGTYISIFLLESLDAAIFLIVLLLFLRYVISVWFVCKRLMIERHRFIRVDFFMTLCFIYSFWFVTGIKGTLLYSFGYIFFLLIQKKDIKEAVFKMRGK